MKTNSSIHVLRGIKKIKIYSRKSLVQFFVMGFIMVFLELTTSCERNERYFRPNLPEKLSSIGIIDVDDTSKFSFSLRDVKDSRNSTRFILFEKSFQSEYPNEKNDSLRDFSFDISNGSEEVFNFVSVNSIKNLLKLEFPANLIFNSGMTYLLKAKERDLPEIYASVTVPEPPSGLVLASFKNEIVQVNLTSTCNVRNIANSVVFDFSFENNFESKNYYMILVLGEGRNASLIPYSGPLDFSVLETNSPGFFAEMQGLNTYHWICKNDSIDGPISPSLAYFIDGSKISMDLCKIKLSVLYNDGYSPVEKLISAKIKLMSIPEELYNFEKNLHTYGKNQGDPFSEPVYLNGNIYGGNGVFAICRSANLNIAIH